jgi:hypothetical protein
LRTKFYHPNFFFGNYLAISRQPCCNAIKVNTAIQYKKPFIFLSSIEFDHLKNIEETVQHVEV